jgi:hypothetical protein
MNPGSRPYAAKSGPIKQRGKFIVIQQPVAGEMFGGKPQQRRDLLNGAPSVHAGIFASVSTGSHNT